MMYIRTHTKQQCPLCKNTYKSKILIKHIRMTVMVVVCCSVAQSCLTLAHCSPPGSSVYETPQARILEWIAISFSRGSSWLKSWTLVSCITNRFFTTWAIGKSFVYLGQAQRYSLFLSLSHTHTHTPLTVTFPFIWTAPESQPLWGTSLPQLAWFLPLSKYTAPTTPSSLTTPSSAPLTSCTFVC